MTIAIQDTINVPKIQKVFSLTDIRESNEITAKGTAQTSVTIKSVDASVI